MRCRLTLPAALAWAVEALGDDAKIRDDDARLKKIIKLKPETLCKRQGECR